MEPEDLEVLYTLENDSTLWDIGPTNVPYSRYTLHDYIATSSDDIYADRQVRFMIENSQRQTVGIVDIVNFDPKNLRAELGLAILNRHRGQGYATDALGQVRRYAKRVLHLHQLYAYVADNNTASLKLFQKCGFQTAAELNDWLYDGSQYHKAWLMQTFL
jgi:diamine N-acetyltransferase